jgi:ABC-type nitrate/sulfonate/bicarbonate transport system substrate-binding protein
MRTGGPVQYPSLLYAPIWLAERSGFLADEGLRVRLRSFGTTDRVTEALRDGVVSVTVGSPEGTILDALRAATLESAVASSTSRLFR